MNPNVDRLPVPDAGVPTNTAEFGDIANMPSQGPEFAPNKEMVAKSPLMPSRDASAATAAHTALPTQAAPMQQNQTTAAATLPAQQVSSEQLERETVARAKAIVAQTKYDPFLQSQEISKLKAEYQKRQFGREITVDRA